MDRMQETAIDQFHEIEKAASQILHADIYFENICEEKIKEELQLNFDLTAIQIFRREEGMIETVSGSGLAKKWAGRAGHYVTRDVELVDIQVDVFYSRAITIITGKDPKGRFDEWMFDYYDHKNLSRAFIPIIIVRDQFGRVRKDWLRRINKGDVDDGLNASSLELIPVIGFTDGSPFFVEVVGTIEVGYQSPRKVQEHEAVAVFNYLSSQAPEWRQRDVGYILEMILNQAVDITGANSGKIFYAKDHERDAYLYQYGKIKLSADIRSAQQTGSLEDDRVLGAFDGKDNRSTTPFRIKENETEKDGFLFLNFNNNEPPSAQQLKIVNRFIEQIKNIFEPTARLVAMKDQVRRQKNLLTMFRILVENNDKNLLKLIANWALNTFSADIVTLYEYDHAEHVFLTPPYMAGRILARYRMTTNIRTEDVPMKFLQEAAKKGYQNDVHYASNVETEMLFHRGDERASLTTGDKPFQIREKIKSVIGMVLCVNQEPVGEMFINYRRRRAFKDCSFDKELIDVLMPVIALVLQNKRQVRKFKDELAGKIGLVIKEDKHPNLVLFKKDGCFYRRGEKIHEYQDGYFLGSVFTEQRLKDLREAVRGAFRKISPILKDVSPDQDPERGVELLLRRISRLIGGTRFCLFEMPDTMNPNVYLEVGLAIGMNRPIVLLKHENAKISSLLQGPWFTAFSSFKGLPDAFIGSGAYIEISRAFDVCRGIPAVEAVCLSYCGTSEIPGSLIADFDFEDFRCALTGVCEQLRLSLRTVDEYRNDQVSTALGNAIRAVQSSRICVFNIDKRMPGDNFLLLGLALALGKRCFLVRPINSEIPSDLQGMTPSLVFASDEDLRKNLFKEIHRELQRYPLRNS